MGIKRAVKNARTVCYVEREAFCVVLLAQKMRRKELDDAPVWSDLTTFDGKPWRGVVDCIVGGFPCQPWSVAGKRRGTTDSRWIWEDIERIICEVRPSFIFLENVPGLLMGGLKHVLGSMAKGGYDAEWGCFTAEEIGAPHKRERVFVLGVENTGGLGCRGWNPKTRPASANKTTGSSGELGDANSLHNETGSSKQKLFPTFRSEISSQELADLVGAGCQRSGFIQTSGSTPEFRLPRFPPRPNELKWWREILKNNPSLEPSFCRVAHGIPDWVDRIAALGNAVVPDQVELAFKTLFYRMSE